MNEIIQQLYQTGKAFDASGTAVDIYPVSIKPAEGELLYWLIRKNNVRRSLETGMALGLSSLHICQALKDSGGTQHVSIDPWQALWFKNIGVLNLQRANLAHLQRTLYCPSHEGLSELIREREGFDFAFVDGNHRFEFVFTDFFLADKILNVGGLITFHDTWMPSIRKVVSFILRNLAGQYELLPDSLNVPPSRIHGIGRFIKMMATDPRDAGVAVLFGRRTFNNICVFRKTAQPPLEVTDLAWDFYRSF